MHFVPISTTGDALDRSFPIWSPFLTKISQRSKETVESLLGQIARREVQIALVWDGQKAHALVGLKFHRRDNDLIGEIVWLAGSGRKQWQHLLSEMEQYFKYMGCAEIRPICRPGWARLIAPQGYRITHYVMEKKLKD